ncbi:MAG TPA: LPS assembly lipoprotein LptE [candidate division Zixibacteria bacterium]|nr:LPS assembly lipoprotein LptE [candidate division Zixibacteria bacterium]
MPRITILFILFLLPVLAGCGFYSFSQAGQSDIKSIAIERIENQTDQLELGDKITDLVIDAFMSDGTMKVASTETADAILTATFTGYSWQPFKYDENDVVESYVVRMTFQVTLKKAGEEADIFNETLSQEGFYQVGSGTEEEAQQDALALLIDAIIGKTTKGW